MYGYLSVPLDSTGVAPDLRGQRKNFVASPQEAVPLEGSYAILEVDVESEGGLVGEIINSRPIKIVRYFPYRRVKLRQIVAHIFGKHLMILRKTEWDLIEGRLAKEQICLICLEQIRQEIPFPKGELCR